MAADASVKGAAAATDSDARPLVSVIIATYNRSNVLALAVESVRRQTVRDWELWVVGDACTDDTAEVVAATGDTRIRFANLDRNVGEQSGPNNEGFRRARGRYIAYLNHDDLWLPDHLETALRGLDETSADLVFTLVDQILPGGRARLVGATPTGRYELYLFVPSSAWILRRELIEQVGLWRPARECYEAPSENFLSRAWRAGKRMFLVPRMTVVSFPSGVRPGVYASREAWEQQAYFERMQREHDFRERELAELACQHAAGEWRLGPLWAAAIKNSIRRLLAGAGVQPMVVRRFLGHFRKGGFIEALRRRRGLPPLGAREGERQ